MAKPSARWISTRNPKTKVATLGETLISPLTPEGGLWIPKEFKEQNFKKFLTNKSSKEKIRADFRDIALELLKPFFKGDPLERKLEGAIEKAFTFDPLLKQVSDFQVLELFHGPTAAFKDFGARFLAQILPQVKSPVHVLVATSGDTGGAVASAFWKVKGTQVTVLFPKGLVSPLQQKQLTTWGENVRAFSVKGNFDDCQRLVKEAFSDAELLKKEQLSSANSISLGRLLPQMSYYAASSVWYFNETGKPLSYVIPTGNVGNAVSAVWAKKLGYPIDRIAMSLNANRGVESYLKTGKIEPKPTIATLANAMDVGSPSNLERLDRTVSTRSLRSALSAKSVQDSEIQSEILKGFQATGEIFCPHTATALFYARELKKREPGKNFCVVGTAHPAKFSSLIEPLIGRPIDRPKSLESIESRPEKMSELATDFRAFKAVLASKS